MMTEEYKIARGWAIFIYVFLIAITAAAGFFLLGPLLGQNYPGQSYFLIAVVCILVIGLMISGIIDTLKTRIIITESSIKHESLYVNRELQFDQIRGFHAKGDNIYLEPFPGCGEPIKIHPYFKDAGELARRITNIFSDLDREAEEEAYREILTTEAFGFDENERKEKLRKAETVAGLMNYSAGILFVWASFYPRPYNAIMILMIVFPWLGAFIVAYYKGVVRIMGKKPYPSISFAIIVPALMLLVRALLDFDIIEMKNVWIPAVCIASASAILFVICSRTAGIREEKNPGVVAGALILMCAYGYGCTLFFNSHFDRSVPQEYAVQTLDKEVRHGKGTFYYLRIPPWGPKKDTENINVPRSVYESVNIGDPVYIFLFKGRFDIPWFILKKSERVG